MNFKAVIFDLDGTLVNSLDDLAESMNTVLRNNNFPTHTIIDYKGFIGNGILNLVRASLPKNVQNEEMIQSYYHQMIDIYEKNCTIKTKPYDGIIDLLKELKSRKIKLAVFSNKADDFTKKIVQELMPDCFDIVIGLTNENYRKPNPTSALYISEKFSIHPKDIIYIGDTGIDMQTAVNAGMYGIGALWGFRTKEELIANGAQDVLVYPMHLIQTI